MTEERYCDRCGKAEAQNILMNVFTWHSNMADFDLCSDCLKLLDKWLKEVKP